jgi:hypothetical protein
LRYFFFNSCHAGFSLHLDLTKNKRKRKKGGKKAGEKEAILEHYPFPSLNYSCKDSQSLEVISFLLLYFLAI